MVRLYIKQDVDYNFQNLRKENYGGDYLKLNLWKINPIWPTRGAWPWTIKSNRTTALMCCDSVVQNPSDKLTTRFVLGNNNQESTLIQQCHCWGRSTCRASSSECRPHSWSWCRLCDNAMLMCWCDVIMPSSLWVSGAPSSLRQPPRGRNIL